MESKKKNSIKRVNRRMIEIAKKQFGQHEFSTKEFELLIYSPNVVRRGGIIGFDNSRASAVLCAAVDLGLVNRVGRGVFKF